MPDEDTKDGFKKIDELFKREILVDKKLHNLLQPFFTTEKERGEFIKKCLTQIRTRRMLLRLQWFSEVADDLEKIKANRPALKLIFVMAMAEGLTKQEFGKKIHSKDAIKIFFGYTSQADKNILVRGFKRALTSAATPQLRFSSIIKILYEVRNKAVHGEDFWSFFFLTKKEKEEFIKDGYTDYGLMTAGYLGRKNKKRVSLDLTLTYEEFRDVIIRTAIANIRSFFKK